MHFSHCSLPRQSFVFYQFSFSRSDFLIVIQSRKLQEDGWKPRWFERDSEDGTYCYKGGYWEAREQGNWDGCPDIFGEIIQGADDSTEY